MADLPVMIVNGGRPTALAGANLSAISATAT